MIEMNGYVLAIILAFAGLTYAVDQVKAPVKAAAVKVEHVAKKIGHGIVHVVTVGQK